KLHILKRIPEVIWTTFCLFLLSLLLMPEINAQTTSYTKAKSFLFSFKEYNDMFLADYGDNAYQLERMGQQLPVSRKRLLGDACHLLIVSHVSAYKPEENAVVNEASLRAARIRAYIKKRFDIPHECVAFYIDRSGVYRDRVHVYLVESPLPWFANTSIYYSESRYANTIEVAIREYGAVPYVDLFRRGEAGGYDREVYRIDDPLFDPSELEDYRLASVVDTPDTEAPLVTTVTTRETVREETKETKVTKAMPAAVAEKTEQHATYFAVKTNLLPWFTVVPSVRLGTGETKIETGSFMPNLAVECFLPVAGRLSCRACMPISPIKRRCATTGRCRYFLWSPASGRYVRASMHG
ncbi:MAG: hypothetical protein LUD46_19700, partial [Parabacteroides sp.]|nr:hypothetical protein [Parabacteroides sp.]